MNHYGKTATVLFRVVGCCAVIYSLIAVVYNFIYAILISNEQTPRGIVAGNVLSCITYFIIGVVIYALSKPLATLVSRRFKED